MKNLKQKAATGLAVGLALAASGCMGELIKGGARMDSNPRRGTSAYGLGSVVGIAEDHRRNKEVAREGRTVVNVDGGYVDNNVNSGFAIVQNLDTRVGIHSAKTTWTDKLDYQNGPKNGYKVAFITNGRLYRKIWLERNDLQNGKTTYIVRDWEDYIQKSGEE